MALADTAMSQADAWRMIRRRAAAASVYAPIGNHRFRAAGITAYLGNGARWSMRSRWPLTRAAYDEVLRPNEGRLTQDEVERIRL
jgi:hypothetical protein